MCLLKKGMKFKMKINIYDFDGTIYDGDSTLDFYFYCLKKNIKIFFLIPKQLFSIFLYFIKVKNKDQMKETFFSFLKYIDDIDEYLINFWNQNYKKIKKWYLDSNHDNDVIISASPEFLLEIPIKKLKIKKLIATLVDKKSGKFLSNNCHGKEKVKRLFEEYSNIIVTKMYTDSLTDKPLLDIALNGYIVKKDNLIIYKKEK